MINAAHSFFQWHIKRIWQRIDARTKDNKNSSGLPSHSEIRRNFFKQIILATAVMMFVNGIGVAFMCWNEGFTFINGLYWSTVTICSIGYGESDNVVLELYRYKCEWWHVVAHSAIELTVCAGSEFQQKQSTILFHIFYIPFAVVVGMMALGQYSAAYLEMRVELRRVAMLKKPLTAQSIRAMDINNDNGVSSGEFLM